MHLHLLLGLRDEKIEGRLENLQLAIIIAFARDYSFSLPIVSSSSLQ